MKEHISRGERRRLNHIEKDRRLAALRRILLQHSDEQIVSLISNWMHSLIGEDAELGGPDEEKLDDLCELLGFYFVSNTTGESYASYSAWRDIEPDEEDCGGDFELDDPADLHRRIKALTLKQIDTTIVDIAYWSKSIQAQEEGLIKPSFMSHPEFFWNPSSRNDMVNQEKRGLGKKSLLS